MKYYIEFTWDHESAVMYCNYQQYCIMKKEERKQNIIIHKEKRRFMNYSIFKNAMHSLFLSL